MSIAANHVARPLTARGTATRARIVDAAADLIYEQGVDRTSLDEVMARSGASKSQLYHYFADKDALVLAVISLQSERVMQAQQPHLGAMDSLKALRLWRDVVVKLNKRARTKGCPLGSLASELSNEYEAARERIAAGFAMWRQSIELGLVHMQERGVLAPSADPHELAVSLLCAVQGGLLMSKTTKSTRPLELALDMAIDHIARHVEPKPRRTPPWKRH